jgi:hypothetical protein
MLLSGALANPAVASAAVASHCAARQTSQAIKLDGNMQQEQQAPRQQPMPTGVTLSL